MATSEVKLEEYSKSFVLKTTEVMQCGPCTTSDRGVCEEQSADGAVVFT